MGEVDKSEALETAVEITKEFARGGYSGGSADRLLEILYEKMVELSEDAKK